MMQLPTLLLLSTAALTVQGFSASGSGSSGTTAAQTYGWGNPTQEDDFDGSSLSSSWGVYSGPGQSGNGERSGSQISVSDSILTIYGTSGGTTGGMAWDNGQKYGRWEARARYTAGTSAYHCVLLLWPDAENWPEGGEIDYSEVGDGTRQELDMFVHYSSSNQQQSGSTDIDMTQWRNFAIEWTPNSITGFVDATPFFNSSDPSIQPPASMHATIQLDWFPSDGPTGTGQMEVDWIRQYSL